ncbi:hypothetical protein JTB14_021290 [Gonioctena quinquepunctata]|nr:hypothetical protein JTB14_021290 [Gonioctena quinquepunctata]
MALIAAAEKEVDILVVSEPNKRLIQNRKWLKDVSVLSRNKGVEVRKTASRNGYLVEEADKQSTRPKRYPEGDKSPIEANYKNENKMLQKLIKTSKREHWRILCEDFNENIWGNEYKIAMGRFSNPNPVGLTGRTGPGHS